MQRAAADDDDDDAVYDDCFQARHQRHVRLRSMNYPSLEQLMSCNDPPRGTFPAYAKDTSIFTEVKEPL